MGVFARLLRKSKATEEASAAEAQAGTEPAGAAADEAVAEPTKESVRESVKEPTAEAAEAKAPEGDGVADGGKAEAVTARGPVAESAEIPRQQSPEEAADNEAGDGART